MSYFAYIIIRMSVFLLFVFRLGPGDETEQRKNNILRCGGNYSLSADPRAWVIERILHVPKAENRLI